ncbi:hypothetical protein CTA2_4386 [Colletotrichum tanaceti]|uniref:Uncharacterized protein n=1 Tax=Colletotrichum tanaceti TaxID=1306861 RepID=A0A4U6XR87_9PEZI|nr:hypothetical protein CTA2_4383 [Colletotrichum tanaceti]KAJ0162554.1 hypothetical protein CTA2_4386 [Colletotrichum tanaceti]TKW58357.1 hypothetical protein CTA1_5177 [Colletotrichum tanaceti]
MSSLFLLAREDSEGGSGAGAGGGMTLPILLAVAIGGGVLLFICLAFLLISLAGRRHRSVARARSATPGARLDLESEGGSIRTPSPLPRPRRLTKQKPGEAYADMAEIQGKPYRSLSSLILPRGKTCGGGHDEDAGGYQRGGHIRRNNSWIDEDAIHGPRVQNDGKRLSIRDSFILRTPTLPELFGHHGHREDGDFRHDHTNYPLQQPRPVSLPAQRSHAPRMPLPRTASYELAEKLAAAARGGVPPNPQSFQQGPPPGPPGPPGQRPVPLQRLRHKTTESDLAEILRSTEERLQNGTPSNSRPVTRQRAASASASAGSSIKTAQQVSPTKSHSPAKARSSIRSLSPAKNQSTARSQSPLKNQIITHVGHALDADAQRPVARTPSPSKRMVAVPMLAATPAHQHKRSVSQCSANSDADSLFGETTPEVEHTQPTGLSSPSRRSDGNSPTKPSENGESVESPGSDASSSLSTLYSVNEPENDSKTGGTRKPEGIVRGRKPKGLVIDTQICDPFVTSGPPEVPLRSPKRQSSSLPPLRRLTPPVQDVVKETIVYAPFHSRSTSNSPVPRPLDVVKRGSVAAGQSQTHEALIMYPSDMAPSPETVQPKSVASMKPVFLVSSTSVGSMQATPGTSPEDNGRPPKPSNTNNNTNNNNRLTFGQKGTVLPPPLNLMPGQGSPDREAVVMGSPESLPRGRTPPTVRSGSGSRTPTSPTRRPLPSPNLSTGSPTPGRYKKRGMASPIRDRALSRQPQIKETRVLSSSDCPSIVLKPMASPRRNSSHRDFAVMGLQSTVAQLRRMNSQMSTFSAGSSVSDPESPTLPNLRGGGFSPDRSNSRVSKMGRQNYLSLGASPKSRRSARSSIRSARNSIAVLKGRPGANKHLDSLRVAVEEKEAEARESSLVRGPRPLVLTPRRAAGRGGSPAETEAATGSAARRRTAHIDGEDEKYLEKTSKRNGVYDSTAVLDLYRKDARLLSSPKSSAAAGTNRHSPSTRI